MHKSVGEIVDALGGTKAVTDLLAFKNLSTVSSWRGRGSIPSDVWLELVTEARKRGAKGVTFKGLVVLHSRCRRGGNGASP